jgi:hypothetical protein
MASNEVAKISETVCSEIKLNGYHLIERREETLVDHMTIVIQTRSIDDRSYAVTKTLTEDKDVVKVVTETEMIQEEVKQFEEDWSNLWNPWDREQESSLKLASYLAKKWNDSSSILKIVK